MRLKRKLLVIVAGMLLSLVAWPVTTHVLAKRRVANYRRALVDKGEELGIKALSPVAKAQPAAALQKLAAVANALGNSPTGSPPMMRYLTNSSTAICASLEPIYPTDDSANTWALLELEFAGKEESLTALRELLPGCRLAAIQDYSQGFGGFPITHLSSIKSAAQWLSAATARDLHNDAGGLAFEDLRALAGLARGNDGEPVMISVLVRLAVSAIAINATWEALQTQAMNDRQWAEIQAIWRELNLLEHAEQALAMERALSEDLFMKGRQSFASVAVFGPGSSAGSALDDLVEVSKKALGEPLDAWNDFRHRFPGYWRWRYWDSYEDELVNLIALQASIEAIREAQQGPSCAAMLRLAEEVDGMLRGHPRAGNWLADMYTPDAYAKSFTARLGDLEIQKRLLVGAICLKRYQLRRGIYPATLNELIPEITLRVPTDLDGAALRYRLKPPETWILYSVGVDLKDDGGAAVRTGKNSTDTRRWYRLRDAVWPSAATLDQVKLEFERANQRRLQKQAQGGNEKGKL